MRQFEAIKRCDPRTLDLLEAVIQSPKDHELWLVLSDCLEEQGEELWALGARRQAQLGQWARQPQQEYPHQPYWEVYCSQNRWDYWKEPLWWLYANWMWDEIPETNLSVTHWFDVQNEAYLFILDWLGRCENFNLV